MEFPPSEDPLFQPFQEQLGFSLNPQQHNLSEVIKVLIIDNTTTMFEENEKQTNLN